MEQRLIATAGGVIALKAAEGATIRIVFPQDGWSRIAIDPMAR